MIASDPSFMVTLDLLHGDTAGKQIAIDTFSADLKVLFVRSLMAKKNVG